MRKLNFIFFLLCGEAPPNTHTRKHTHTHTQKDRQTDREQSREQGGKRKRAPTSKPGSIGAHRKPPYSRYCEWTPRDFQTEHPEFRMENPRDSERTSRDFQMKDHEIRMETHKEDPPRRTPDCRPPTNPPNPGLPNYRKFTRTSPKSNKFKWN